MYDAYAELIFGLLAAIVLVYLLIVVNFQSWLDPFIIITALPGALAGIAWALFLTHTRLSEPALTGAIMTMGTGTANSILVVSYARERLEEHGDALRAAIEAGNDPLPSGAHDRLGHDLRDGPHGDRLFPECAAGSRRHRWLARCHPLHPVLRALRVCHYIQPANRSAKGRCLMMKTTAWKTHCRFSDPARCALSRLSIYERSIDAAVLQQADARRRQSPPWPSSIQSRCRATETITLPGNIVGWFEAPIYARVTGYVEDVVQGLRGKSEERRHPCRNQRAGA